MTQLAAILGTQDLAALLVQSELVTGGEMRHAGEYLKAEGNIGGLVAAGYVVPVSKAQLKLAVQCDVEGCERVFMDLDSMQAHKQRAHDPAWNEMRQRLAEDLDPEPAPRSEAGSIRAAREILPVGVAGDRMGGPSDEE